MMDWKHYQIAFRLRSPLHIGYRKIGNLMQTRSYVPGKNLWAVLTTRLTRNIYNKPGGKDYKYIGNDLVKKYFRFTYFWPAINPDNNGEVEDWSDLRTYFTFDIDKSYINNFKNLYPMKDKKNKIKDFDYLFMDSYASTALDYDKKSSEEGSLHEVEFISPVTRDGRPVYLVGSIWMSDNLPKELKTWEDRLKNISIGGEQKYGWGRLKLLFCEEIEKVYFINPDSFDWSGPLPVHLSSEKTPPEVQGTLEPLVGWETKESGKQEVSDAPIAFSPGTSINNKVSIKDYGLWHIKDS